MQAGGYLRVEAEFFGEVLGFLRPVDHHLLLVVVPRECRLRFAFEVMRLEFRL